MEVLAVEVRRDTPNNTHPRLHLDRLEISSKAGMRLRVLVAEIHVEDFRKVRRLVLVEIQRLRGLTYPEARRPFDRLMN